MNTTNMTIKDIENLTYDMAKQLSVEVLNIKEHECFIVDFNNDFGYSVLVYKNQKQVYYANDYELYHEYIAKENYHYKEALRNWYLETLSKRLFTDEELMEEISSYDEYERKRHFLHNYWIMRYNHVSCFSAKLTKEMKKKYPFFCRVCFCYTDNKEAVDMAADYEFHLNMQYENLKHAAATFKEMVRYELANHEACITGRYEDALDALGLRYEELTEGQKAIVKEELRQQIKMCNRF